MGQHCNTLEIKVKRLKNKKIKTVGISSPPPLTSARALDRVIARAIARAFFMCPEKNFSLSILFYASAYALAKKAVKRAAPIGGGLKAHGLYLFLREKVLGLCPKPHKLFKKSLIKNFKSMRFAHAFFMLPIKLTKSTFTCNLKMQRQVRMRLLKKRSSALRLSGVG